MASKSGAGWLVDPRTGGVGWSGGTLGEVLGGNSLDFSWSVTTHVGSNRFHQTGSLARMRLSCLSDGRIGHNEHFPSEVPLWQLSAYRTSLGHNSAWHPGLDIHLHISAISVIADWFHSTGSICSTFNQTCLSVGHLSNIIISMQVYHLGMNMLSISPRQNTVWVNSWISILPRDSILLAGFLAYCYYLDFIIGGPRNTCESLVKT